MNDEKKRHRTRWFPVSSTYMDIDTDWKWERSANVDFHLELKDDGTFMRMFKDEINEVPEYPEELKDK